MHGVAYDADIIAAKYLQTSVDHSEQIINSKARIINNSWGPSPDINTDSNGNPIKRPNGTWDYEQVTLQDNIDTYGPYLPDIEAMGNISFFYPKEHQGSALGVNGGLGNLGVSVMQLVAPIVVTLPVFAFFGVDGVTQADGSTLWLPNASLIWVPLLLLATLAAWFGMNDIASSKASVAEQLPVLKRLHMWLLSLLYLATFGSFIGFSAGFAMLAKTQFPEVEILKLAFFGPFLGALARSVGGMLSDKLGGVRVTLVNFIFMAVFSGLLFLTLPNANGGGNFIAFYAVFMGLFLTAGLGSGSTFQMIAVIFRRLTLERVKQRGGSEEEAQHEAVTDTAAALGFISAIGAIGGFFIPKAFGSSLAMTGSPVGAMKIFLVFYIACVLITWLVYGRKTLNTR